MAQKQTKSKVVLPGQPWGAAAALAVSFAAYIVSQVALGLLLVPLFITKGENAVSEGFDAPWISLLVSALSSAVMLGVVWLFLRSKKVKIRDLGFYKPKPRGIALTAVAYIVYFALLLVAVSIITALVPSFNAEEAQDIGYVGASGWQLMLAFLGLVIIAPITEEIFFRGFLYRGLARSWPRWIAVLSASLLFGLAHFQWNVGVDVFILSLALIYVFEKTGNLWLCIGLHSAKNLIAFLALFVFMSS